jgi:hypothetical protein
MPFTCAACHGQGEVHVPTCSHCGRCECGAGLTTCDVCAGTGKVRCDDCQRERAEYLVYDVRVCRECARRNYCAEGRHPTSETSDFGPMPHLNLHLYYCALCGSRIEVPIAEGAA